MGKEIVIGGNRLGSGEKRKQYMYGYERSNHDLSYNWKSTMAPGTLVPFMAELMLPGDTFDIKLSADVLTHPTVGPLFGSFKLQLDVFQVPIRLYQAQLHNNKLGIGMDMSKIKLPQILFQDINTPDPDLPIPISIQQINPGSLFGYLDIAGVGNKIGVGNDINRKFNAIKYLAYYDIYKNYYANKQEEIGAIIDYNNIQVPSISTVLGKAYSETGVPIIYNLPEAITSSMYWWVRGKGITPETIILDLDTAGGVSAIDATIGAITVTTEEDGTISIEGKFKSQYISDEFQGAAISAEYPINDEPQITTFPLKNIDDMREDILAGVKSTAEFEINRTKYAPYGNNLKSTEINKYIRSFLPMQGLALKTYQNDLYQNWVSTEWIDGTNGINSITAVDVSAGSLKLDSLNLAQKVYNMLNRIAISGGSYQDWIEAVYSEEGYRTAETPIYMGGISKEIVFQEIISNAATANEPLGSLAGKGKAIGENSGEITIKVDEPSYAIGIISVTPRIDYSQGIKWDNNLKTMDDLHKPALDAIGFQDLITDQMAWWDTDAANTGGTNIVTRSAGKVPAWSNYMTNVNKVYGLFADERSEMFMVLGRNYEYDKTNKKIKDLTTYIDPAKFNYAFAQTDRSAQNFWVEVGVRNMARRKISAKQIPNL